ncbi:dihydrodipicolinate synthase family protein [Streptomyces sp. NPDC001407]|uniref:dihydrodipicolinate synthase family protein n=1 Tax=Streptomyces sp. NPDC001407 TaxID=3364573 RepID=UPI003679FD48
MIRLPDASGALRPHEPNERPLEPVAPGGPPASRTLFAAAHVVADPYGNTTPYGPADLDWDATLAFRHHLWAHGLAVAEAMDTAQRGAGLDWTRAAELIRRSTAEARAVGGRIACGAGTDHLTPPYGSLEDVTAAYEEQLDVVEAHGAQAVVLASRALAAVATGPDDYRWTYGRLLSQTSGPVILHWLGPVFDPALEGYWGSDDLDSAARTLLDIVSAHREKVDGVKVSLLDAGRERALRRRLPAGVRCFTGDDLHYPELIEGDEHGHSDALLGVFDPLGPLAVDAARRLDAGDRRGFRERLDPALALSRHLFEPPTRAYKAGVVLLAWLAGHQEHFTMVAGQHAARSLPHLARAYELADELGLFPDPERAEARMARLLALHGVGP